VTCLVLEDTSWTRDIECDDHILFVDQDEVKALP